MSIEQTIVKKTHPVGVLWKYPFFTPEGCYVYRTDDSQEIAPCRGAMSIKKASLYTRPLNIDICHKSLCVFRLAMSNVSCHLYIAPLRGAVAGLHGFL